MDNVSKFGLDPEDETQYIDDWENPEYILRFDVDAIFARLGLRDFLIQRDGYFNPRLILEMDWRSRGKEVYKKHLPLVKEKMCIVYCVTLFFLVLV